VLAALRLDAARLPGPRADGDREALRILLTARQEIAVACTAQGNRLRALLLAGDDADRPGRPSGPEQDGPLAALAGRELPARASRDHAVRQSEIRRLALAPGQARSGSRTTARSCWPSSMTSPPVSPAATGSGRSAPPRPS
jgi:hypothetical protein